MALPILGHTSPRQKHRTLRKVIVIVAMLLASMATACGSVPRETSPSPVRPVPTVTVPFELPVTIAISGRLDDQTQAILDDQIAQFEEQNPDIKVAFIAAPRKEANRHRRFSAQLATGDTSADVYAFDPIWLSEFDANGWLTHLDAYAQTQNIKLDEFLPSTIQANTVDGHLVALPWFADGGLLYYRRDLLEKYGYDPPDMWDELQKIALDIMAKEDLPYGFVWQGTPNESLTCNTLEFVWAHGGDVLDVNANAIFDSPETRSALHQMSDLVTQGVSPPDVTSFNENRALSAFQSGDAVFMRNWAYAWNRLVGADSPLAGQVGLAPLPASCLGGQSLALSAHSLHPEQAFRFMSFLVGANQQLLLARQANQTPSLASVYLEPELLAQDPAYAGLYAALSTSRPRPQSPAYLAISEAIFSETHTMLMGEQDVAAAVANIQRRIEAAIPQ